MKKSALKERIRVLEEDLSQLQAAFDSEKTTLISKDEHKNFINQLHEMHSQETAKLKEQIKRGIEEVETREQTIRQITTQFEDEKATRANLHNELQYSKVQLTKVSEEAKALSVKVVNAERKAEQARISEELASKLELKVQELVMERKSLESAHREMVMDLNGKINEKDQSLQQAVQVKEKLQN